MKCSADLAWTIEFETGALKQLSLIGTVEASRISRYLEHHISPHANPRSLDKALQGSKLGKFWRFRVGDYRIVCDIQDQRVVVLVVGIGHRSTVYKDR